jgi:hypothetical protein
MFADFGKNVKKTSTKNGFPEYFCKMNAIRVMFVKQEKCARVTSGN